MSNLPPSLQPSNSQRQTGIPDDIWLAPPLEGDNGIGLSGVGDARMWFGNGGLSMGDTSGNNAREFAYAPCWQRSRGLPMSPLVRRE